MQVFCFQYLKETCLDISKNLVSEAILTNIQKICFMRNCLSEAILTNSKSICFMGEIRIKQGLSYISVSSFSILYKSKFILMATSLGTNAFV